MPFFDRLCFAPSDAEYVEELAGYVARPSVSRDASPAEMRAAAEWLVDQLGFAGGRIEATAGRLREGMRAWEVLWRLLADGPHRLAPIP